MWRTYWQDIDETRQDEVLCSLLKATRGCELYWQRRGSKFATAFCGGGWVVTMKLTEYSELPQVVAEKGSMAVLLVCDRQRSRAATRVMLHLLYDVESQLAPMDGDENDERRECQDRRIEDEIAKKLQQTISEEFACTLVNVLRNYLRGR